MKSLKFIKGIGVTSAAAIALTMGASVNAEAAIGKFYYTNPGGTQSIDSPANNYCYVLSGGASTVTNSTDTVAHVYNNASCMGAPYYVNAGQTYNGYAFAVKFW
ncbi:hypothetical protein ACR820_34605 [Streptomyces netropsis]